MRCRILRLYLLLTCSIDFLSRLSRAQYIPGSNSRSTSSVMVFHLLLFTLRRLLDPYLTGRSGLSDNSGSRRDCCSEPLIFLQSSLLGDRAGVQSSRLRVAREFSRYTYINNIYVYRFYFCFSKVVLRLILTSSFDNCWIHC